MYCIVCLFRTKPLLIIHGAQRAEKAALDMEAAAFDHIKLGQAKLEILYGTHHTYDTKYINYHSKLVLDEFSCSQFTLKLLN